MVFSEPFFLFIFLPIAILLINLSIGRGHNYAILLFSLIFYYWSSGLAVLLLCLSILGNWGVGLLLNRYRLKAIITGGIIFNLVLLGFFKYAYFFAENASFLIGHEGKKSVCEYHSSHWDFVFHISRRFLPDRYLAKRYSCRKELGSVWCLPFIFSAVDRRTDRSFQRCHQGLQ